MVGKEDIADHTGRKGKRLKFNMINKVQNTDDNAPELWVSSVLATGRYMYKRKFYYFMPDSIA